MDQENIVNRIELLTIDSKLLDELILYAWQVYQDPNTRFYPIVDQISDLEKMYQKAYENGYLWACTIDDQYAVLALIVDEEEKYIQANGGIATKQNFDISADFFLSMLRDQYPGYSFHFAYPSSHQEAMVYSKKHGYLLDEILLRYEVILNSMPVDKQSSYQTLNEDNYKLFKEYHEKAYKDVYWTAKRIYEQLQRWTVVLLGNEDIEGIAAAISYEKMGIMYAELYAFSGLDIPKLMSALIHELKEHGVQKLVYFVEHEDNELTSFLESNGFKKADDYHSFSVYL